MSQYAIFDLDNCLSNDEWRIAHIRFNLPDNTDEKWDAYHQLCAGDNPANQRLVYSAVERGLRCAFITMRPESVREMTVEWIRKHLLTDPFMLCMRPDGDHRPSVELKREAALRLKMNGHGLVEAYDDRADIVDMYRSLGIMVARVVRIHNRSCHRPAPATADEDAAPSPMPLAPPTRGAQPPPRPFPFTTDPIAGFDKTTGAEAAAPQGLRAGDYLRAAATTFENKNAEYGDDYRHFGKVASALFPNGLRVSTVDDWNRLALFMWALSKMGRYAKNMDSGGHADSALDLSVYAAMLREMTV